MTLFTRVTVSPSTASNTSNFLTRCTLYLFYKCVYNIKIPKKGLNSVKHSQNVNKEIKNVT